MPIPLSPAPRFVASRFRFRLEISTVADDGPYTPVALLNCEEAARKLAELCAMDGCGFARVTIASKVLYVVGPGAVECE